MAEFETPKGTKLPLLNLRGKTYLEVKWRIVWFCEEKADWTIETEMIHSDDSYSIFRAVIKDPSGRILRTAMKREDKSHFADHMEKAETSAIGRAIALLGYGTQFTEDLEEGERIVDAPVQPKNQTATKQQSRPPQTTKPTQAPAQKREMPPPPGAPPQREVWEQPTDEVNLGSAGEFVITFGRKYKNRKLKDIPQKELKGYIDWLDANPPREGTAIYHQLNQLKDAYNLIYDNIPQ